LQTQYRIWLPTFYIARTPVTLAQCSAFAAATGCRTEAEERGAGEVLLAAGAVVGRGVSWRHPTGRDSDAANKQDHPVIGLMYSDVQAYCVLPVAGILTPAVKQQRSIR
jgi:formylglycine-generating enzyme required for sulfatase activity